jgi:hypothetical protein
MNHFCLTTITLLSTLILAACPGDGNDDSIGDSTTSATASGSSSSSTETTSIMGSTSAPGTGTDGGFSSGDDPTTESGPYEGHGKCAGFGPATCNPDVAEFCDDVVLRCMSSEINVEMPDFCAALGDQCEKELATPCTVCKNLWNQCVRLSGDVVDQRCEDMAKQCSCLAESHGAV